MSHFGNHFVRNHFGGGHWGQIVVTGPAGKFVACAPTVVNGQIVVPNTSVGTGVAQSKSNAIGNAPTKGNLAAVTPSVTNGNAVASVTKALQSEAKSLSNANIDSKSVNSVSAETQKGSNVTDAPTVNKGEAK